MSIPGSGLLAALRRKNQPPAEPAAVDPSTFGARNAAVMAVEQAVATGNTPEQAKKSAKGRAIAPAGGDYTYNLDESHPGEEQLDLKFQPVTRVASEYKEANLRQIAVNDEFITYGLKQGHIRVLHRFSEARALLKGHTGPIADVCFLGRNLLAAGGQNGELYVWRLTVQDGDNAIHGEQIIRAKFSPGCDTSPILVASAAESSDSSPAMVVAVAEAVILLDVPQQGALDLEIDPLDPTPGRTMPNFPVQDAPKSISVSPDGRYLAAGSKHGKVYVCRIEGGSLKAAAKIDADNTAVTFVGFVTSEANGCTLCVGTKNGSVQTLYSSTDAAASFTRGDRVILSASAAPSPFIHAHIVMEQNVVVLADTPRKAIYTLHWSPTGSGGSGGATFDYFARFKVTTSVINFTALWNPDLEEDGTVELSCVQPDAVQQYFLNPDTFFDGRAAGAVPAAFNIPQPAASASLPLPSPGLANGGGGGGGGREGSSAFDDGVTETSSEQCASPPPTPAEPVSTHQVPMPISIPPVVPEPEDLPQPQASPAPGAPPKLLTPTDILRSQTPEHAKKAPAPAAAALKVLQRAESSSAKDKDKAATPVEPAAEDFPVPPSPAMSPAPASTAAGEAARPDVAAAVAEEMSGVHRKFAGHVSAMYKELLKAMKAEMSAQAAAQQAATTSLFREALAAQAAAVQAERTAILAEERASMERLLSAISSTLNNDLPARLQEAVRTELAGISSTMASGLAPAVQAAVAAALPKETSSAVKAALEKQLAASLQSGLTKPIQDAFRQSFSKQIVPSFENACQSMFLQIDKTFSKGLSEHTEAAKAALTEPASLAASLRESLALVDGLSGGGGSGGLQRSVSGVSAASSMRSPRAPDVKTELRALVSAGRYEEAFSKALGMQDVATVSWLCTQADAATVLSASPPALSQMVVLSLIQQLAADLGSGNPSGKLQWIREAAMVLNPRDPMLGPHLRPVLEQVHGALSASVPRLQGGDASSCKLAMHVVHSQMTS